MNVLVPAAHGARCCPSSCQTWTFILRRRICSASNASDHVSAVDATRKKQKQKTARVLSSEKADTVCAAYCVHNPVALFRVASFFRKSSFKAIQDGAERTYKNQDLKIHAGDVVHAPFDELDCNSKLRGHAFFFSSGAAVFWGLPMDLRRQLIQELGKFQDPKASSVSPGMHPDNCHLPLEMEDFEHEFNYRVEIDRKRPSFINDEIYLTDFEDAEQLLAFSYGLAQSVKLLVFEEVIDALVLRTRSLPDALAREGKIKLSHRDIKCLIGELLAARYSVNLVSDIKDTPEYFWQHPELEALFQECAREVELRQRARILDSRTQVIKEALDILNNELSSTSSDRVERAILFLIAVEVSVELARMVHAWVVS
ncbi:Sad1-interacting factor 2 [Gracilariopsis chorda]|uniref:Sad1-interacting factor 2 n=1 Tax=Gracilariopsis chorda TaxID=448386 RepID=A0A2V3IW68_9FLOR|nr:Sad1-interacting factor 2 [Gracilariopsis chorda]|eukprot:PXF45380.1 Sad1-interacting factor 2 [Gracilariopsis chorda]